MIYIPNMQGGGTVDVNIREFPQDLHRLAKVQAAMEGITLKALIIKALEQYLNKAKKKRR
jgi:predicted HicB family RNase H-like nuclease